MTSTGCTHTLRIGACQVKIILKYHKGLTSLTHACRASYFMYALYSDVAERQNTNSTPTRILLLTALHWKSTRRFTDKLADSLQLDY